MNTIRKQKNDRTGAETDQNANKNHITISARAEKHPIM